MLSPGDFHLQVPRNPKKNVEYRLRLYADCSKSRHLRDATREMCRRDVLYWVNSFAWQYNPKHLNLETGPFCTWPFQDEFLRYGSETTYGMLGAIEDQHDLVVEKSREVGASWLTILEFLWLWLYHPGKNFLLVSRNEELVDSKSPKSLFWKIDFLLKHLPGWLLPEGFDPRKHRSERFLENPENGSTVTGEASTKAAAVGDRLTAILYDEFARFASGKKGADFETFRASADASLCRVFVSTHVGEATAFNKICTAGVTRKVVLHWTMHPEKSAGLYRVDDQGRAVLDPHFEYPPGFVPVTDGTPDGGPFPRVRSPWYDGEVVRRNDRRGVAMDLDINVQGTVSQFFDPQSVRRLLKQTARPPVWRGELYYDRSRGRPVKLIPREGGPLSLWTLPDPHGRVRPSLYAAGADVAEGTGASPSSLTLFDCKTGEKVGLLKSAWINKHEFAAYCVALCTLFADDGGRGAFFCWEMAGPGLKFGRDVVEEYKYAHIYYRKDHFKDERRLDSPEEITSDTPGWYPSTRSKRLLLENYRHALDDGLFLNPSEEGLLECLAFQWDERGEKIFHPKERSDDPSGAGVNHGDEVVADALAWLAASEVGYIPQRQQVAENEPPYLSLAWVRQQADRRREARRDHRSILRR